MQKVKSSYLKFWRKVKCKIKFEVIPSSEKYHIFIPMTSILCIRPTHLTHDRNFTLNIRYRSSLTDKIWISIPSCTTESNSFMMLAFLHHLSSNRSKVNNYLHLVNPKNLLLLRYILLIRISKWKIEVISIEVDSFMALLENAENTLFACVSYFYTPI